MITLLLTLTFAMAQTPAPKKCAGPSKGFDERQKAEILAIQNNQARTYYTYDGDMIPYETPSTDYTVSVQIGGRSVPVQARKFKATTTPSLGTVVFFCGGPAACMGQRPVNIPLNYDVVVSDSIGIGRNTLGPATPEMTSLEGQGVANRAIVRALGLKNYMIYGQSFGTGTATVTAALIGKDPTMAQPKSVVLEGVVGTTPGAEYARTAERAWQMLTGEEQQQFRDYYKSATAGMLPQHVHNFHLGLVYSLTTGPGAMANTIRSLIRPTFGGASAAGLALNGAAVSADFTTSPESYLRIYGSAACQFKLNQMPFNPKPVRLFGGLMPLPYGSGYCDCRTIARDYLPKEHQIKAPILYINGDQDPSTPIEGARDHFKSQEIANKTFLAVPDGGHFSSWNELAPCQDEIFAGGMAGNFRALAPPLALPAACMPAPGPAQPRPTTQ